MSIKTVLVLFCVVACAFANKATVRVRARARMCARRFVALARRLTRLLCVRACLLCVCR